MPPPCQGLARATRDASSSRPGFATAAEARRQRDALLRQLQRDGTPLQDPTGEQYIVLQYNPPYTLPWLRRNEVGLMLATEPPVQPEAAAPQDPAAPAAGEAAPAAADTDAAEQILEEEEEEDTSPSD